VFLLGKAWRTNHRREHLLAACAGSREELGIDAFDCYALHWPSALEHRGELNRLAEKPVERQETLTFPEGEDGEPATADVALATAWRNLEAVHERGWARTLGICNVSRAQLETVLETGEIDPALVQVERHPYRPRNGLVELCHGRGIPRRRALAAVGARPPRRARPERDRNGARALTRRSRHRVERFSRSRPDPVQHRRVARRLEPGRRGERLTADEVARIDALRDPNFER